MNYRVSIAPMMNCTDRHERYFLRLIAPHVLLYTEMVTCNALLYGDYQRLLAFDPLEHPIALQLGGCEPEKLQQCAKLGEACGYDEINLNVGCPSDRVQAGRFGACLMREPTLVAECVSAMCAVVNIPVTVKCRIGVDHEDSYDALTNFISTVSEAGCKIFIIHARKAWLNGLSPKENREIPPLRYDIVRQIKRDFPHLTIVINGGIKTVHAIEEHLTTVDGVMIGREAYANPYFLAAIEKNIFSENDETIATRHEVIARFIPYVEQQLKNNVKLSNMTRHIYGLYHGQKGARVWRRHLSEHSRSLEGSRMIHDALRCLENCAR